MHALITGGAGFIGSHLCERLARDGAELVVLDALSSGKREHLDGLGAALRFMEAHRVGQGRRSSYRRRPSGRKESRSWAKGARNES